MGGDESVMKSGFVSIVGKPNVGKSTLLNRLTGSKLAAVSNKPQTTRQIIRGILTERRGQIYVGQRHALQKPRPASLQLEGERRAARPDRGAGGD